MTDRYVAAYITFISILKELFWVFLIVLKTAARESSSVMSQKSHPAFSTDRPAACFRAAAGPVDLSVIHIRTASRPGGGGEMSAVLRQMQNHTVTTVELSAKTGSRLFSEACEAVEEGDVRLFFLDTFKKYYRKCHLL